MNPRLELDLVERELDSGLRILCAPLPAAHRCAVVVHVRTGSRFEPPELGGVTHFLEHMLHRGTLGHPSAHQLALAFEDLGSELSAATYVDHLVLSAEGPAPHAERLIELLGEVVRAPIFGEIELERGIVREEILESLDEDGNRIDADELLLGLAFPDHGLGRPITGALSALARFDRETLIRCHREHYRAGSLVVSVSGAVDPELVLPRIAASFRDLPPGGPPSSDPPDPLSGPHFTYADDSGSQTALRVGFRAPGEHSPLEPATELLLRILDDGMSTRLYRRVCDERGLAYDVSASYEAFADSGFFSMGADVAHARADQLMATLYDLVRELRDQGPTSDELSRAKRRFSWQAEALFDQPLELADFLGLGALTGASRTPREREQQLEAIDPAALGQAARSLFVPEGLAVAVVGHLPKGTRLRLESLTQDF